MMIRVMLVGIFFTIILPGCGGGSSPCENLCQELTPELIATIPDVSDVDCSKTIYTSAKTCAECSAALAQEYDVTLLNPEEKCYKYFKEQASY
jgi:hypothetical protein